MSVGFDGSDPAPRPPFNKAVHLKVERAGNGQGQVEGSGKVGGSGRPAVEHRLWRRLRCRPVSSTRPRCGCGQWRVAGSDFEQLGGAAVSQRGHLHLHGRQVPEGRRPSSGSPAVTARPSLVTRHGDRDEGRRGPSSSGSGRTPPLARTCGCCGTGGRLGQEELRRGRGHEPADRPGAEQREARVGRRRVEVVGPRRQDAHVPQVAPTRSRTGRLRRSPPKRSLSTARGASEHACSLPSATTTQRVAAWRSRYEPSPQAQLRSRRETVALAYALRVVETLTRSGRHAIGIRGAWR